MRRPGKMTFILEPRVQIRTRTALCSYVAVSPWTKGVVVECLMLLFFLEAKSF
jgi:hypothetical protein